MLVRPPQRAAWEAVHIYGEGKDVLPGGTAEQGWGQPGGSQAHGAKQMLQWGKEWDKEQASSPCWLAVDEDAAPTWSFTAPSGPAAQRMSLIRVAVEICSRLQAMGPAGLHVHGLLAHASGRQFPRCKVRLLKPCSLIQTLWLHSAMC